MFAGVFVSDLRAADFIGLGFPPKAAQDGAFIEQHFVGLAVVDDGLGLAFPKLVQAFAFLAEKGRLLGAARYSAILGALAVLGELQAIAADGDAAAGEHHLAAKNRDLFDAVVAQAVGLDLHRLAHVRFFGVHRQRQQGAEQGQDAMRRFHRGTKIAESIYRAL